MSKHNMDVEDVCVGPNCPGGGYNRYATKKTIAEGSFEIALLITNAVQLKVLLGHMDRTPLWWVGIALVSASLLIQVLNGCILVILGLDDITKQRRQTRLVSLNNLSLILSVILSAVNIVLNVIVAVDSNLLSTVNPNKTTLKIT
ncbi:unnamed protein product [Didymodactylos carnosus]|uniref:Ninjurin-2 n=1 Tax=Didymodactylos carnosus TaxID=1234261 RepID=A0A814NJG9_9BILA|nr:unnamed protein product [Didymodactylos carnosus]CAF1092961.1 unnamed protein product [Didymodactylos carnosus]CAF3642748.1 unnamed protein product [Didymodactylos carnosus]CAF3858364.1 unnamed protein product [Didymodactylos carnosus]